MVLGAGAMRSAGLKNITAKHLAMASQSISILISIIPYTRECLRRHLRAKQAVILVDFDKLKRDCQEHQNEIHAKLVAIMGDRLAVHCKALQEIDWESGTNVGGQPNAYMETLVKETGTLHKVLLKYLAGSALEVVMMQVLSAINSRLAEEFSKIPLKSQTAKDRMLADANFLKERFADLKGLERAPPGAELVHLVQDKMIEHPQTQSKPSNQPKPRQFSTPSLTRPHKDVRSHSRTTSAVSITQIDDQPIPASETVQPPRNDGIVEASSTATQTENEVQQTSENATKPEEKPPQANDPGDILAETVPLPTSPESEVPPSITEILQTEAQPKPSQAEEAAPLTPSKDVRAFSPPPADKPHDTHGTPTGNVKNRLAGLFAKRPALPQIPVPTVPNLPHISVPAVPNLLPKTVLTMGKPAATDTPDGTASAVTLQEKQNDVPKSDEVEQSEPTVAEDSDEHDDAASRPMQPAPVSSTEKSLEEHAVSPMNEASAIVGDEIAKPETLEAVESVEPPSQPAAKSTETEDTSTPVEEPPIQTSDSDIETHLPQPTTQDPVEDPADTSGSTESTIDSELEGGSVEDAHKDTDRARDDLDEID